jgi:hypothetical protein
MRTSTLPTPRLPCVGVDRHKPEERPAGVGGSLRISARIDGQKYTSPESLLTQPFALIPTCRRARVYDRIRACPAQFSPKVIQAISQPIAKAVALVVALLYLGGFVVVSVHLSRHGVASFTLLQLQYLVAGVWALAPPALTAFVKDASSKFEQRVAPDVPGRFNWRRFRWSLVSGIPYALTTNFAVSYLLLSYVGWKTGAILFAFYLSMMVSAYWSWESWRRPQQNETVFINRNQAPFHFSLFIAILGVYVVWFSLHIYPIIPYSFGGGRPLMVQFIESDKPLPASLVRDDKTQRTVPYRLLEATDKRYYVISENQTEQSIEINRDSVDGMVVLKDAAK